MSSTSLLRRQQLVARIAQLSAELADATQELYEMEGVAPAPVKLNVVKRPKKKELNGQLAALHHVQQMTEKYNNQSKGNGKSTHTN